MGKHCDHTHHKTRRQWECKLIRLDQVQHQVRNLLPYVERSSQIIQRRSCVCCSWLFGNNLIQGGVLKNEIAKSSDEHGKLAVVIVLNYNIVIQLSYYHLTPAQLLLCSSYTVYHVPGAQHFILCVELRDSGFLYHVFFLSVKTRYIFLVRFVFL